VSPLIERAVDFLCKPRTPWRGLVVSARAYGWIIIALLILIAVSLTIDVLTALMS
jgi:hypothetical protein